MSYDDAKALLFQALVPKPDERYEFTDRYITSSLLVDSVVGDRIHCTAWLERSDTWTGCASTRWWNASLCNGRLKRVIR